MANQSKIYHLKVDWCRLESWQSWKSPDSFQHPLSPRLDPCPLFKCCHDVANICRSYLIRASKSTKKYGPHLVGEKNIHFPRKKHALNSPIPVAKNKPSKYHPISLVVEKNVTSAVLRFYISAKFQLFYFQAARYPGLDLFIWKKGGFFRLAFF